jgi:hypothetical protein
MFLQTDWTNRDHKKYSKNQGIIETKQKPVAVGDMTTYRTLSSEGTPLQNGTDK